MGCLLKQGGLHTRVRIGAVLLAAGEGRRMGGVPKALIRLQGVPLINRHLVALSGAGVDEVVVVTGFARAAVEEAVRPFSIRLAHNERWQDGQPGSVRAGLAALEGPFDAIMVVLADQPLVGTGDLVEMIGAFKKRPAGHIVVPVVDGQRGNPVVLDGEARALILAGDVNAACRQLIEQHPELVHVHETANPRFVTDLDTLEDMQRLAGRTGWRLELPPMEAATL
ncbi:MAG TPA: nucleotidyltransferase family protein [Usitatibacter sp.]|nr:nucleotidyltransferase family protein [Usitatibacter sp.]